MVVKLIEPAMGRRPMDTSLKARMAPHLGLLVIARIVEDAGHTVRIVNENVEADDPDEACRYIDMGIDTILTNDYLRVANAVKAHLKSR